MAKNTKALKKFLDQATRDIKSHTERVIQTLGSAAASCYTMGLVKIDQEDIRPFNKKLVDSLDPGDKVFCVGRTLYRLFDNQKEQIERCLKKGVNLEFAMCDYKYCLEKQMRFITKTTKNDFEEMFGKLAGLETEFKYQRPTGSLKLFFHDVYLPDTLFAIFRNGNSNVPETVYWIPYFGREPDPVKEQDVAFDKRSIIKVTFQMGVGTDGTDMRQKLYERFSSILENTKGWEGENLHEQLDRREPVYCLPRTEKMPTADDVKNKYDDYIARYAQKLGVQPDQTKPSLRIFISYRRNDSDFAAYLIREKLQQEFGSAAVIFRDTASYGTGDKWKEEINTNVGNCNVLLLLIGLHWDAASENKMTDWVEAEVSRAGKLEKPIIPVLLGEGTLIPPQNKLPDGMKNVEYRQGITIPADEKYFQGRIDELISAIKKVRDKKSNQS